MRSLLARITPGLAVLSLAVLIWGIAQGEAGQVLVKGINICLECIGLG